MRLFTRDDPGQAAAADAAVGRSFEITATVLLELEWVLRSPYGWSREERVAGLRRLLDLPHADAYPAHARWALERFAQGADFADMMHLASASEASAFATFDRKLARLAGDDAPVTVETLA